jgi:hypothetical protein
MGFPRSYTRNSAFRPNDGIGEDSEIGEDLPLRIPNVAMFFPTVSTRVHARSLLEDVVFHPVDGGAYFGMVGLRDPQFDQLERQGIFGGALA